MEPVKPIPAEPKRRRITFQQWEEEGKRRFGEDRKQWPFVCPRCKTVQTAQDLIDANIDINVINHRLAFSCIGRLIEGKGCNWTLGGLFQLHELEIEYPNGDIRPTFEFAEVADGTR